MPHSDIRRVETNRHENELGKTLLYYTTLFYCILLVGAGLFTARYRLLGANQRIFRIIYSYAVFTYSTRDCLKSIREIRTNFIRGDLKLQHMGCYFISDNLIISQIRNFDTVNILDLVLLLQIDYSAVSVAGDGGRHLRLHGF